RLALQHIERLQSVCAMLHPSLLPSVDRLYSQTVKLASCGTSAGWGHRSAPFLLPKNDDTIVEREPANEKDEHEREKSTNREESASSHHKEARAKDESPQHSTVKQVGGTVPPRSKKRRGKTPPPPIVLQKSPKHEPRSK
ncbi:hypothetical protein, partial [Paenibacillus turpanensis]|uniref:hypothetical protein n=1 Tax=Paenibacillus turpanensis TaxID=2689078 RepID=UPI00140D23F6